ncbi:GNAT family N-acetyltransferase [Salipiger sp. P9]|uniref:GNAT family N-acetyltransferase n=1 Tax=Salipiger pentaromativorans TaxID=2943193 RepID=UPI002157CE48|nr:GNAT family N-acetyltransferase [Salipiger pentaromativorans]MCR8550842.1 GNAT family N-acetyltransferase [Salipiger pentaromativorans]
MSVTIPVVETDRLILRAPRFEDLDALCGFYADPRAHFIGGPLDRGEVWRLLLRTAGHWQIRGYGIWHITLRDTGDMIGHTGVLHHIEWPEPELCYGIFAGFEGKGFAHEAAEAARVAAAGHFGLTRLISPIDPANDRSRALLLRLGAHFEREDTLLGQTVHVYRHPEQRGDA